MNFTRVGKVSRIGKGVDLPPDEKKKLPPPEFLSDVYQSDGFFVVDLKDNLGREWSLTAKTTGMLRKKLRYFKSLSNLMIEALLPIPISQWKRNKAFVCKVCGESQRIHPVVTLFGCAKCDSMEVEFVPVAVEKTVCPKCGRSTSDVPRSKYCGDGSDKDNEHDWQRISPDAPKPQQTEKSATDQPKRSSRLLEKMKQRQADQKMP